MPRSIRPLVAPFHLKIALLITACLAASVITIGARRRLTSAQAIPRFDAQVQSPVSAQSQAQTDRVEVELITARSAGFEPAEITRPSGRFILAVDNRTELDELVLRLEQEHGNSLRE